MPSRSSPTTPSSVRRRVLRVRRTEAYLDGHLEPNDIRAGERGRLHGYIEKATDNLVGVTWRNDEVQHYTGSGLNDLQMPEKWSYAGYTLQHPQRGEPALVSHRPPQQLQLHLHGRPRRQHSATW